MKQIISHLILEKSINPKNILYINFELEDFINIINYLDLSEIIKLFIKNNDIK
jgi:hypothetical protein